jgi:hypothetical protein
MFWYGIDAYDTGRVIAGCWRSGIFSSVNFPDIEILETSKSRELIPFNRFDAGSPRSSLAGAVSSRGL